MAGSESVQRKLTRVRPPRVKITYDVEIGNAIEMKELPFIVGILADLAGKTPENPKPLKDRKFVEIDRDNFDSVLKSIGPELDVNVPNHLAGPDAGKVTIPYKFENIDDFRPEALVERYEPLRQLLAKRNMLRDLLTKADGSDKWATLIGQSIQSNTAVAGALPAPDSAT